MKLLVFAVAFGVAGSALAQAPTGEHVPSGQPDMTKMGPLSRKVTKPDKQGIEALYKASDQVWMKGDIQAAAALHDFPVYMATDDSHGMVYGDQWSKQQFVQMMGDAASHMPKDISYKHKLTPHFLSDTLAVVIDDVTMMQGNKNLGSFKSAALVVNKGGRWLFKGGMEAGWGNMSSEQTGTAQP